MTDKWDESRLVSYIENQIEENINLDYKGADSLAKSDGKKKEIAKDVSAFANANGGLIIYGIREFDEKEKSHLPEKLDPVDRMDFSKEWLEHIINSNIAPKVKNLKIHSITIGDNDSNQVAYVVDIPQGHTAHQAQDKRYYKRYNFESVAMEDYEIKDIINRKAKAEIELRLNIDMDSERVQELLERKSDFYINSSIYAYNRGGVIAKYLEVFICGTEEQIPYIRKPHVIQQPSFQIRFSNEKAREIELENEKHIISVDRFPILPNTSYNIGEFNIWSKLIYDNHELVFLFSTENSSSEVVVSGEQILGVIK